MALNYNYERFIRELTDYDITGSSLRMLYGTSFLVIFLNFIGAIVCFVSGDTGYGIVGLISCLVSAFAFYKLISDEFGFYIGVYCVNGALLNLSLLANGSYNNGWLSAVKLESTVTINLLSSFLPFLAALMMLCMGFLAVIVGNILKYFHSKATA